MRRFIYLFTSLAIMACSNPTSSDTDNSNSEENSVIEFNITNAKALVAIEKSPESGRSTTETSNSTLLKLIEDGTIESALSIGTEEVPSIDYISLCDQDGSVFIVFNSLHDIPISETEIKTMQFVRVFTDNTYDVIWPLTNDEEYQISGSSYRPILEAFDGNLYFMTEHRDVPEQNQIWCYSLSLKTEPVHVTESKGAYQISEYDVDVNGNVYVTPFSGTGYDSMDCFYSGSYVVQNIIPEDSSYIFDFAASPFGSSVLVSKGGLSNIQIDSDSSYTENDFYPTGLSGKSFHEILYDESLNLYGISSTAFVDPEITLIEDENSNEIISTNTLPHATEGPQRYEIIGNLLYYIYGDTTGSQRNHKLCRYNLQTQSTDEILTDSIFDGTDLLIDRFEVSNDNEKIFIYAYDYNSQTYIVGEIDLVNGMIFTDSTLEEEVVGFVIF